MSDIAIRPGIRLGSYPQLKESVEDGLEDKIGRWFSRLAQEFKRKKYSQAQISRKIKQFDESLQNISDTQLDELIEDIRLRLHCHGLQEALVIESFAIVREASARVLGKRHFDTQIFGGWIMMNGMLAEMQTGEGKTLTTTLPACTAALAGIPVHVITANDYLAARDCEITEPLYHRLGLTAAPVVSGMEFDECQQAYGTDIVHTTNKQVAFDYLRDRIVMGDDTGDLRFQYRQIQRQRNQSGGKGLLLRGLCFAIVDEADSVLIDEANTPLIITKTIPNDDPDDVYSDALYLASKLVEDDHFTLHQKFRSVELTLEGIDYLEDQVPGLPKFWRNQRKRENLVRQALSATHFFECDREYVIADGKVQIVDQSTGRLMPDRSWEQGLHQMIEAKEGCLISEQREPQARISYQKFFRRYLRLSGASGTLSEVKDELNSVYGLKVLKVSTHQPNKRLMNGEKIYRDSNTKQRALIDRVKSLHALGRPILIGTGSVEESELVGSWLDEESIPNRVLNAKQDKDEADIIAVAGQPGAVTVATNMAGRGTDIGLGDGVDELGGLHVISVALNDSFRVDRQLFGRCARQGDSGSAEAILSLQDPMFLQRYSPAKRQFLSTLCGQAKPIPGLPGRAMLRRMQNAYEKKQCRIRKALVKQDLRLKRTLAFAGRFE